MKKRIFVTAVAVSCCIIHAQAQQTNTLANIDNKGNILVGGNFKANLSFKSNSSSTGYDLAFSPRFGYYFFKGFAAGIDLNGQYSKEAREKINIFGAGPFIRYHLLPSLFTELAYDYNTRDLTIYPEKGDKPVTTSSYHNDVYSAGIGYIVALHKHLTLEPRLDYTITMAGGAIQSQGPGFSISLHNYFWK